MNAPIPEVPDAKAGAPPLKPPFRGLNVMCGIDLCLVVIITLLGTVFLKADPDPEFSREIFFFLALFACSFAVVHLFFLWRGSNFARWIYWMSVAVTTAWIPFATDESYSIFPEFETVFNITNTLFSIIFAVWLALPGVARHFRGESVK